MTLICSYKRRPLPQIALLLTSTVVALSPFEASAITPTPPAADTSAQANIETDNQPNIQSPIELSARPRRRSRPRVSRPSPPPRLPPNRVQPGGGLEDSPQACDRARPPLSALIPEQNPVYSAQNRPTFLFHLSDNPADIDKAEFILLSADEKEQIYVAQFVPDQAGIVSVSLPAEAPPLEPGQSYHWYFNLYCRTTTAVPSVNGWVQRVNASPLSQELQPNTALPEIWYDAIAQTADLLANGDRPESSLMFQAQVNWQNWLEAIGLGELIGVPLVGPVTPGLMTSSAEASEP